MAPEKSPGTTAGQNARGVAWLCRYYYQRVLREIPWARRRSQISTDYAVITEAQARQLNARGWFRQSTANRQQRAYEALLRAMHAGDVRKDLAIAVGALDSLELGHGTILEIGCGGGYYSDVLATLCRSKFDYTGIDNAPAMIALARQRFPIARFEVGDATALPFPENSFDVAFNGVSLMHILDYEKAIAEARRVARVACVFHGVPVFAHHSTVYLSKYGYGAPMTEIVFNRDALIACFVRNRLRVETASAGLTYDVSHVVGEASYTETYVCKPC